MVGVGPGEQVRQVAEVVRPVDDVDPRRAFGDRRTILLRETATDDDREVATLVAPGLLDALEMAEGPVEPLVSVLADRARVEQDRSASSGSSARR